MSLRLIIFISLISLVQSVDGQRIVNSPLTRLAFGDIVGNDFYHSINAGPLSATFKRRNQTNFANPASYGYIRSTIFEVGMSATNRSVIESGNRSDSWAGRLGYLSLAIPLQNDLNAILEREEKKVRWGIGFTLKPFSAVGYNIQNAATVDGSGEVLLRRFTGEGGAYTASFSNGVSYKDLSIGANIGVIFGKSSIERVFQLENDENSAVDIYEDETSYSGFTWDIGIQYDVVLQREIKADGSEGQGIRFITLGAYGHSDWNVKGNSEISLRNEFNSPISIFPVFRDTLLFNISDNGDITIPAKLGFGVSYTELDKWNAGVNIELNQWSKYKIVLRSRLFAEAGISDFAIPA
jgi:hypothetical protein